MMLNEMITSQAGYYNGLNDAVGNGLKAIAPLAAGSIFAASTRSGTQPRFPFDEHLAFVCVALLCGLALWLSRGISSGTRRPAAAAGGGAVALTSTHAKV